MFDFVFFSIFKDMVVERSKNIQQICPNLLHFLVNSTFWDCKTFLIKDYKKILQKCDNFTS